MTGVCSRISEDGVVQISDDTQTIDTKQHGGRLPKYDRRPFYLIYGGTQMKQVKREIYYTDLSPVVGSEQGGVRPVLVLQNDKGNCYSPTTIVAAVTSKTEKTELPTHVKISADGLKAPSIVLLEQLRTIDKARLGDYAGRLNKDTMGKVDHALITSLGVKCMEALL